MRVSSITVLLAVALCIAGCHGDDGSSGKPGGSDAKTSGQGKKTSGSDAAGGGADTSGKSNDDKGSTPTDVVKIAPADQAKAGIRIAPVQVRQVARQLSVAGQVAMDERHTDHIGVLADGLIERVFVLPGDSVRAGQTLALLHSHAVHETVGALTQAFAAVDRQTSAVHFAEINRERYQHLLSLQVASQEEAQRAEQQLRQSQQDLTDAQANVHMEREHLSELLQVPPASLTPATLGDRELVPVRAVAAGSVIARNVTPGQVVSMGTDAFVVSNLATVWVTAAVNEVDLPQVRRGAHATLTTQGYPGTSFPASVAMLGDQLDPQTRTIPVRLAVPNPGTRLRPGMFVTASIDEPSSTNAIFIPEDALQDVNGLRVVFVTNDGTNFQVRAVKPGTRSQGLVQIVEGLKPTDHVVVDGAFMVKGELLKGSVGEE